MEDTHSYTQLTTDKTRKVPMWLTIYSLEALLETVIRGRGRCRPAAHICCCSNLPLGPLLVIQMRTILLQWFHEGKASADLPSLSSSGLGCLRYITLALQGAWLLTFGLLVLVLHPVPLLLWLSSCNACPGSKMKDQTSERKSQWPSGGDKKQRSRDSRLEIKPPAASSDTSRDPPWCLFKRP